VLDVDEPFVELLLFALLAMLLAFVESAAVLDGAVLEFVWASAAPPAMPAALSATAVSFMIAFIFISWLIGWDPRSGRRSPAMAVPSTAMRREETTTCGQREPASGLPQACRGLAHRAARASARPAPVRSFTGAHAS
jgi:hypothetical protein